ncbi:glycosyltransferase family 39 protein [Amycolatopsis carbonis]|uniref:Glycosyltransferase family 39 protein n=1 Tax=Amycolatopsis carbonis TaxID=715471 RepID=A0A9Y2MVU7_9PSEU|nr:glycosyltransferase family 39 protein [Amycolatopsis sp. 2-15]WIX77274.1 glycosyltransferase family 39 protein [Amycolatopsis sp. 2-15]
MTTLLSAPTPATTPTGASARLGYLRAAGVYLAVRVVGVVVLALFASSTGQPLLDRLTAWDGQWYLAIADDGYSGITHGLVDAAGNFAPNTPLAFFPLYPFLMHALATGTGLDSTTAGLLISAIAGIVAALGVYRLGKRAGEERTGLLLVALWAGAPLSITLSMVYTEALFTAFVAWALVGLVEKRWALAALCCVAAGLTRPTAVVLVGVVVFAGVVAFVRAPRPAPLVAAAAAPVGLVGYWLWVANRTGSLFGWFDLEWHGWNTRFDAGAETFGFVGRQLVQGRSVMEVGNVFVVFLAIIAAVLLLLRLRERPSWWPLILFGVGMVVLVAGTAGIPFAKARFLLPGFVLLLPLAQGLTGRRRSTAIAATAGVVLVGCWFSAYALTGWRYAI